MEEVALKTHLIVTDMHEEYIVDWFGKLSEVKPKLINNIPNFILISKEHRIELNTFDIKKIEECAKEMTNPHGRKAVSTDTTRIYIEEEDGSKVLIGSVVHNHIKKYAPMYDNVWQK